MRFLARGPKIGSLKVTLAQRMYTLPDRGNDCSYIVVAPGNKDLAPTYRLHWPREKRARLFDKYF